MENQKWYSHRTHSGATPGAKGANVPDMSISNLSGQTIGQYALREVYGTGGMGAVYRAYQLNLEREVAFKSYRPRFQATGNMLKDFIVRQSYLRRWSIQISSPYTITVNMNRSRM